jgi:hypothetical protein
MRDHIAQGGVTLPLGSVLNPIAFPQVFNSDDNLVAHFKNLKP